MVEYATAHTERAARVPVHCFLGGGGRWQDLNVISLVPRYSTRQENRVRLSILGHKRDDLLHVFTDKSLGICVWCVRAHVAQDRISA